MRDERKTADLPVEPLVRPATAMALQPGAVLDQRYELLSVIGKGAFGTVYEARHRVLEDRRAVKVLPMLARNDPTSTQRFLREARILAKLKHPNLVEVSDAGMTPDGQRYLVMELLHGKTLADWLAQTPVEKRDATFIQTLLEYFVGLCEALDVAHEQGVIHRDLRPANIFLHQDRYETVVKLLDFGVARAEDDTKLTLTGDMLGTVAYMAPEQVRGQAPDPRFDTYGLGVVLYEALTGKLPVAMDGSNDDAIHRLLQPTSEVAPPESLNPHVTRPLSRVCLRAIERDSRARFQTAEELGEELSKLTPYDQALVATSKEELPVPARRRSPAWLVAAILLGVGVAAAGWWLATAQSSPPSPTLAKAGSLSLPRRGGAESIKWPAFSAAAVSAPSESLSRLEPRRTAPLPSLPEREEPATIPIGPSAEAQLAECQAALRMLRLDDAEPCFERVLAEHPSHAAQAHFGLGKVSFERKQYPKAVERLSRAVAISGKPSWRVLLGQAHLIAGDKAAAADQWRQVAQQTSDGEAQTRAQSLLAANGLMQ